MKLLIVWQILLVTTLRGMYREQYGEYASCKRLNCDTWSCWLVLLQTWWDKWCGQQGVWSGEGHGENEGWMERYVLWTHSLQRHGELFLALILFTFSLSSSSSTSSPSLTSFLLSRSSSSPAASSSSFYFSTSSLLLTFDDILWLLMYENHIRELRIKKWTLQSWTLLEQ